MPRRRNALIAASTCGRGRSVKPDRRSDNFTSPPPPRALGARLNASSTRLITASLAAGNGALVRPTASRTAASISALPDVRAVRNAAANDARSEVDRDNTPGDGATGDGAAATGAGVPPPPPAPKLVVSFRSREPARPPDVPVFSIAQPPTTR